MSRGYGTRFCIFQGWRRGLTDLKLVSEFATDEEMEKAEKSGRLYAANAYGINTGGQPNPQRAKEAY